MLIGVRLRQLREQKQMSQGDIEERTGLLRCYISRVENGHTVPSLETLERFAGVLDVPLYQLFYSGEEAPPTPSLTPRKTVEELTGENAEKGLAPQFLLKLRNLLSRLTEPDRDVILSLSRLAEPDRDVILNLAQRLAAR
jgi:transcriptional regulator with XRE-family HTH domain